MTMSKKKIILLVTALVVAIAVIGGAYLLWTNGNSGDSGEKIITVQIVPLDQPTEEIKLETTAGTLGEALKDARLVRGEESATGLFITQVKDYTANPANKEWWCITKGGATVDTGVDSTIIADGEVYELTLMVGW